MFGPFQIGIDDADRTPPAEMKLSCLSTAATGSETTQGDSGAVGIAPPALSAHDGRVEVLPRPQ